MWLSTGTMAPYAATQQYPAVLEPCHYLVSIDHEHFTAVYHFISGDEPSVWGFSVVLRRLLFPLLSFPLTRIFGILAGGVMASFALQILGVTGFAFFVRRRVGESAAIAVLWLLATYPGITYWSGLPYSYVTIVPGSLACLMLLYRVQVAATPASSRAAA